MCICEHIEYLCGHRSSSVIRPCPATTADVQFPVCSHPGIWTFVAKTMCPMCERIIHNRWVLIREWEHRWIHERGACGCNIIFPGTEYQPWVSEPPIGVRREDAGGPALSATTRLQSQRFIPPLYRAELARDGRPAASIRVSGLCAAEWLIDHRELHRTGQCECPADFSTFRAAISENGLDRDEQDLLQKYRDQQMAEPGQPFDTTEQPFATGKGDSAGEDSSIEGSTIEDNTIENGPVEDSIEVSSGTGASANTIATIRRPLGNTADNTLSPWRSMSRQHAGETNHWSTEGESYGIAGLPLGAGPEGKLHMPDFYAECTLGRRPPHRRHSFSL
ncbi:hypothetical protein GQ53DRAFT_806300 [Thozetella sp. PMI_491]|nr:hypothetical protein GQ53DRAFT_806300 [Thozetella sp. PMI_491]